MFSVSPLYLGRLRRNCLCNQLINQTAVKLDIVFLYEIIAFYHQSRPSHSVLVRSCSFRSILVRSYPFLSVPTRSCLFLPVLVRSYPSLSVSVGFCPVPVPFLLAPIRPLSSCPSLLASIRPYPSLSVPIHPYLSTGH